MLLTCFVSKDDADLALRGVILEENSVEQNVNKVSNLCLEDDVDMELIHNYFSEEAWFAVNHVLEQKKDVPNWLCNLCELDLGLHSAVCCDACLQWFHLTCLGMDRAPETENWFCQDCTNFD